MYGDKDKGNMFIFAALKKIAFVVLWKTVKGNQE